ncbi:MAG: hypothetical protein M1815_002578 [Lichina confinis]|nr:MAG: hypothetical protein M1815_002578 [Lichina confinis]
MLEAMRAMAARRPYETASVNHTWHTPLIPRPASVSLETKRTGEGWDKAIMQSGIWAAAHIAKLGRLVADVGGDPKTIPTLPLVVVQGHDWYFPAASAGEHGRTNIWSKARFGTTSAALGVYQIVATIQYLAHWTRTVYRPWFSKMALGLEIPAASGPSTNTQMLELEPRSTVRAKGKGNGRGRGRGKSSF